MYDIPRKISGNHQQSNKLVKYRNGILLTIHEEQINRWKEHFEQLRNQPEPKIIPVIPAAHIDTEPLTSGEISKTIRLLNNTKTVGADGIPAGILKAGVNTSVGSYEYCQNAYGKRRKCHGNGKVT